VLVVSHISVGWFGPRPIRWLNPQSDADFLGAISEFDRIVLHDLLCPAADPRFLGEMAAAGGSATAAVRPLVETVKAMRGDVVAGTLDRDVLRVVTSPVVVDRDVLAEVPDVVEALSDFAVLVSRLRAITPVALEPAPAGAVRVSDAADLRLLALHRSS
jgi:2-C-methyl-D-erythritol 4-phosphate cytidylyltransferase